MSAKEKEENPLDKITYGHDGKVLGTIQDYLTSQEDKEIDDHIKAETREKRFQTGQHLPIPTKVRYQEKKERSGKVMNITNREKNKRPVNHYLNCKSIKHLVIAHLLTGKPYSAKGMFENLKAEIQNSVALRQMMEDKKLQYVQVSGVLSRIHTRTELAKYIEVKKVKPDTGQPHNVYTMNPEGCNLSFEQAIDFKELQFPTGFRKKKPRLQRKRPATSVPLFVDEALKNVVDKKEYDSFVKYINELFSNMEKSIDGFNRDLQVYSKLKGLELKVSGHVDIRFGWIKD